VLKKKVKDMMSSFETCLPLWHSTLHHKSVTN